MSQRRSMRRKVVRSNRESGSRRRVAPTWELVVGQIGPDADPLGLYEPLLMMDSASGFLLSFEVGTADERARTALSLLEQTVLTVGGILPGRIRVPATDLEDALAPEAAELGVTLEVVEPSPEALEVRRSMATRAFPALYEASFIGADTGQRTLAETAETVAVTAPWELLREWELLHIAIDGEAPGPYPFASVIGRAGECFGVVLYRRAEDYARSIAALADSGDRDAEVQNVAVWFNEAHEMSPDAQPLYRALGAGASGLFPVFAAVEGLTPRDLTADEVDWMVWCLRAVRRLAELQREDPDRADTVVEAVLPWEDGRVVRIVRQDAPPALSQARHRARVRRTGLGAWMAPISAEFLVGAITAQLPPQLRRHVREMPFTRTLLSRGDADAPVLFLQGLKSDALALAKDIPPGTMVTLRPGHGGVGIGLGPGSRVELDCRVVDLESVRPITGGPPEGIPGLVLLVGGGTRLRQLQPKHVVAVVPVSFKVDTRSQAAPGPDGAEP